MIDTIRVFISGDSWFSNSLLGDRIASIAQENPIEWVALKFFNGKVCTIVVSKIILGGAIGAHSGLGQERLTLRSC